MPRSEPLPHRPPGGPWLDDLQALLTALMLVSLGLSLLAAAGLLTGGAPGLALLLSHWAGWPLGATLFAVNLPSYLLAWRMLGPRFTLRTLAAVAALSVGVEALPRWLALQSVQLAYAALAGGTLIGVGLLVMFRHRTSLGGVNIVALTLQQRLGWRAGAVQMAIDAAILGAGFLVLDPVRAAWSLAGSLAVNAVLLFNHRPAA